MNYNLNFKWCFPDGYTIYDSYKNVINNDEIPKIRQLYPSFQKHSIRDEMSNYKKIQNLDF